MNVRVLSVALACSVACASKGGPKEEPTPAPARRWKSSPAGDPAAKIAAPAAPISLTAGDGTGLAMVKLDARAAVDGPLAFTELHLTFQNPEDRVLEGRFAITLPDGAAVSRFAMKIGGEWMEAEMVERQAARRAYEDFLHRRQDPALLEKEAGNEFRARVFPIPARGTKELIVAYSQELADPDAPFVLPLRGLPRIGEVTARIQVARTEGVHLRWSDITLAEKDWQPDRDLTAPGSGTSHALGAPGVVAMRVRPELAAEPDPMTRVTVLVDTSASRALGFAAHAREVEALVAALGRDHQTLAVVVAAFDQGVEEIYRGAAVAAGGRIEAGLLARRALGASRLDGALAWAKAQGPGRVIVITDAVATAGDSDAAKLGAAVTALGAGVERLDVILAGGVRDRATAEAMTRGRLARDGAVLELTSGVDEVARRLTLATRSGIVVKVDGARWVWPEKLDSMQPGDAAMIYASFDGTETPAKVAVTLGTDRRELVVEPAAAPLVDRAAAAAEIARRQFALGAITDPAARAKAAKQIVELSTSHRVLSDLTALLVLETEADYARFAIDRKSLAGILVVGADGVEVKTRADIVLITDEPVAKPKRRPEPEPDTNTDRGETASSEDMPPPPEEEEEKEDDGDDESGGTGTAMALDEGRMGKRESDRAEGQYRMRNRDEDPQLAREQAAESARSAGILGTEALQQGGERAPLTQSSSSAGSGDGTPKAYAGRMATIMDMLAAGKKQDALAEAQRWRDEDPAEVLALIAIGEAYEALGKIADAARAYGSIIDLFPARADLRRFAGERLDRLAGSADGAEARDLAVETYRRAVEQRPDHLTGHRLLAFALLRAGRPAEAFAAIEFGLAQSYPPGRFQAGDRILREDLSLIGAAWKRLEPKQAADIARRVRATGIAPATTPSLRFVLVWETDGNDVDFHIKDAKGGHAFYSQRTLPSGGMLYADITDGYGPECFTITGKPTAAPYNLSIHYYSRGPMGYGMGKLQVLRHDGDGNLTFEDRPFVVMNDQAFVDLGDVR